LIEFRYREHYSQTNANTAEPIVGTGSRVRHVPCGAGAAPSLERFTSTFGDRMKFVAAFCFLALLTTATRASDIAGAVSGFSRNLRNYGLATDVTVSGHVFELHRITKEGGTVRYSIQAEITCNEKLSDVRVTLERGEEGSLSFFLADLYSAPELIGTIVLGRVEVGTKNPTETLTFYAKRLSNGIATHLFWCRVPLADFMKRTPNQSTDPTLTSGTPAAGQPARHP
jgi:hypothetical protein